MNESQALRPANDFDERYFGQLRKITAHKELAVAAALHYCAEEKVIPPTWVIVGSNALLCDLLKREKAQTRGRATGHLARYRQDTWDLERWNAVDQIRQIRAKVQHGEDFLKANPDWQPDCFTEHNRKMRQWLQRHGTFACASMYLYGRYSRVGADAMKASHRRVQHANEDRSNTRYCFIDPRFLWEVGIDDRIEVPGTKFVPLYNLTP
jgi:hypothetical protein